MLPADVDATSIYPHAHYLAKDMQALATLPDGTKRWLLWIKSWDFRWQDQYRYASPVALPAGTVLSMRITYDNSLDNPHNSRRPPVRVKWGRSRPTRWARCGSRCSRAGKKTCPRSRGTTASDRFWRTSPARKCR